MISDAMLQRHKAYMARHQHGPAGEAGLRAYRRFISGTKGSPGAYDQRGGLPRSARRSTDYVQRPAMIAGDRSLPGFAMLPVRTWQGSTDFYLAGAGRGMARDENGEARTELAAWARENMSPEDAGRLEELIAAIIEDHEAEREQREQPKLTKHLQRKHALNDAEIERVKDLIIGKDQTGRAPPFGRFDTPLYKQQGGRLAMDPPVSEAQSRAMHAAAEGRREVGEHFVGKDAEEWVGSERPAPRLAPPLEEPADDPETAALKRILAKYSTFSVGEVNHLVEQVHKARKAQPKQSSGFTGDSARHRASFAERFPTVARVPPFAPVSSMRTFI
jgi:hypothetical protein